MTIEELEAAKERIEKGEAVYNELLELIEWDKKAVISDDSMTQKSIVYFTNGTNCYPFQGELLKRVVRAGLVAEIERLEKEFKSL